LTTARILAFALLSIGCWEFIRFLGTVVIQGLKTGSIRHTNAQSTASREENPWMFWMLVMVFSAGCLIAAFIWTSFLFDVADVLAGQRLGTLWEPIIRVAMAAMCGLPAAVIGFSTAGGVLRGLRTGVMVTPNEAVIARADEPARYWASVLVWSLVAMLVLLIGFVAGGHFLGWID
jgi:hypothetical protein